jgi:hypothetical protein
MKTTRTELHARGAKIIEAQRAKHAQRNPIPCDTCGSVSGPVAGGRMTAYRCQPCCDRIGKRNIGKPHV